MERFNNNYSPKSGIIICINTIAVILFDKAVSYGEVRICAEYAVGVVWGAVAIEGDFGIVDDDVGLIGPDAVVAIVVDGAVVECGIGVVDTDAVAEVVDDAAVIEDGVAVICAFDAAAERGFVAIIADGAVGDIYIAVGGESEAVLGIWGNGTIIEEG